MVNTAGAYILVLVYSAFNQGGVAMQEFPNLESCKAAIVQLQDDHGYLHRLSGFCIAKDVQK